MCPASPQELLGYATAASLFATHVVLAQLLCLGVAHIVQTKEWLETRRRIVVVVVVVVILLALYRLFFQLLNEVGNGRLIVIIIRVAFVVVWLDLLQQAIHHVARCYV